MDRLVQNIAEDRSLTAEVKEEVYKLILDCKTVAQYNPRLAIELYHDAILLSYRTGTSIIHDIFKR